jgi:hypothetical protein
VSRHKSQLVHTSFCIHCGSNKSGERAFVPFQPLQKLAGFAAGSRIRCPPALGRKITVRTRLTMCIRSHVLQGERYTNGDHQGRSEQLVAVLHNEAQDHEADSRKQQRAQPQKPGQSGSTFCTLVAHQVRTERFLVLADHAFARCSCGPGQGRRGTHLLLALVSRRPHTFHP